MVCESYCGGVYAYVNQLCNDMVDNFEVYLVYSKIKRGGRRPATPDNFENQLNPKIHLIELSEMSNIKKFYFSMKELKRIKKEVNPDIIHLHSTYAGVIGRIAFCKIEEPVLYMPHGYSFILMGKGIKSLIYKLVEVIIGKYTNAITVTCCKSEEDVAKEISHKTAYIETGINVKKFDSVISEIVPTKRERFTVFMLGRICVQKRPELFNDIAELVPDAEFLWIGEGELKSLLIAPNIKVTGWKTRTEALQLAQSADIFVLCSYGEAISMSLLENMYLKKLCLVSNTMGNKSVISDGVNGYVCESAEEYAGRIKDAMKKYPWKLSERAYQDILEIYNAEIMKKKYISFYKKLLSKDAC